ncbi:RNA polymerase sigma factor [Virgibacillus sp. C22-A2]|uniref:RNA polymerase sigma factor n=1 Tax=Virgibacillus tibetensis TaxID=3042313 RepID=A0ABU6KI20_9BACI|nr:RNA polymerase sigma factor [Virgibacillus sp. C22-A2]
MIDKDTKLIRKIKKGNQQAFKKLYDSYADYSLRTAYGITKNKADASDIVQETFIKVYRNIETFDMTKPFKAWFYQILINEARRYVKKRNKQTISIESDELLDYLHQHTVEEINYDDLGLTMEQLQESHRTVLILKYLNGFTDKEIAEVLDANVNTVKSRLYKARQQLKAIMGGAADGGQ